MPEHDQPLRTERTRLRRMSERGSYDRDSLYALLDAQPFCHLGFVRDGGPTVIPTIQWREGDRVYWHGSSGSRALAAADGARVCLTVTLVDGLVLARSGLHHSVNFRSAMLFGEAETVTDDDAAIQLLNAMVDSLIPGRSELLRPISTKDIRATKVQGMAITEASVKVRDGGVADEEADYELPIWAGILPLTMTTGAAIDDPRNLPGVTMPPGTDDFRIG